MVIRKPMQLSKAGCTGKNQVLQLPQHPALTLFPPPIRYILIAFFKPCAGAILLRLC